MSTESLLACGHDGPQPLVSVVIPLHNASIWIIETLASVCAQDRGGTSFEIIVVDDGSNDGSAELACAFLADCDVNARVLRVTNGGPSVARNVGWRAARGQWIQFLDADDLLHPQKLRDQGAVCATTKLSTAVVYSDFCRLEREGDDWVEKAPRCAPRVSENTLESLIRAEHFLQIGCALIRRQWLDIVGGFDEKQWVIEDVNLLIRIALAGGRFMHVATAYPVLHYRQHPSSLSRRRDDLFASGCFGNAKLVERYWHETESMTPQRRALLGQIYAFSAGLMTTQSPPAGRAMLADVVRLTAPAITRSRAARRVFLRAFAYRYLGWGVAGACERAYLRTVATMRGCSADRRPPSARGRAGASAAEA